MSESMVERVARAMMAAKFPRRPDGVEIPVLALDLPQEALTKLAEAAIGGASSCCFCMKSQGEDVLLTTNGFVFICEECVGVAEASFAEFRRGKSRFAARCDINGHVFWQSGHAATIDEALR